MATSKHGAPAPAHKSSSHESGIGAGFVSPSGMMMLVGAIIVAVAVLLDGLAAFWPANTPAACPPGDTSRVVFLGRYLTVSNEQRLLLIVMMAGALGGLLHSIRSLAWYIGNRKLKWSWAPRYVLLPFSGAVLSLVFYFVLRAGLLSSSAAITDTNPFGIAALGSLVGLFSEAAVLKLKTVAETVFTAPSEGRDPAPTAKKPAAAPHAEGEHSPRPHAPEGEQAELPGPREEQEATAPHDEGAAHAPAQASPARAHARLAVQGSSTIG